MRKFLVAAALSVLLGSCGAGTDSDGRIFPYAYDLSDLPNGLRSVVVDSGYPNIVALYVVMQVGSRNEVEPGRSGFAHLFEHMMFRGSEKFPPERWEQIMQDAGAATNAYTSDDRTVYHAVFSKDDLESILELEADRFQNLSYGEDVFRTETRAVLGEYNKNFANPFRKLDEALRNTIFDRHTYKHSTMGFVEDVEAMPEMYDYGLQFFDRYYRPEYATIAVVGDVDFEQTQALIEKYWGGWEQGSHAPEIPAEPEQQESKTVDIPFHAPTPPLLSVVFRAPAYDDELVDSAALDLISFYAFGESSPLYKELVLEQQTVDILAASYYDHLDPYPFAVTARVKQPSDVDQVESRILEAFADLREQPPPADRLEDIKSHLRYQFALSMNSTTAIADTLAHYLSLRRTPETINKRYRLYQSITPADIQAVARKYFREEARTIARLTYSEDAKTQEAGQ